VTAPCAPVQRGFGLHSIAACAWDWRDTWWRTYSLVLLATLRLSWTTKQAHDALTRLRFAMSTGVPQHTDDEVRATVMCLAATEIAGLDCSATRYVHGP
jgi:hypothetical protein